MNHLEQQSIQSEADPFASVRVNKPRSTSSDEQDSSQDAFSSVRVKKSEDIPFIHEAGRHAARIGSRIAETIGGIPGDVSSLIQSGVITGLKKLTGHELSSEGYEEIKKQRLPTSSELKKFSEEKSGGFTKAKNEYEKIGDELAELTTSLIGPIKFRRALGIAAGAQSVKEGFKILGFGDKSQEAGKLGTMLMLTALNPKGALKYAGEQFNLASQLSRGSSIQATNMRGHLENLLKDLQKGIKTPSKNAVIRPIEDILGKVNNNKILVHDLTAAKRDLNTLMKDPELLRRERKLLKTVGKEIDTAIKPYEKINPAFSKAYRPANEIFGAVAEGTKAYDFMRKHLGGKTVLGATLGELALGHPEYIAPTIGTVGATLGIAKTTDFFVRLAKSRELKKYYSKALVSAMKEDLPALRKYSDLIDKEFTKDHRREKVSRENK